MANFVLEITSTGNNESKYDYILMVDFEDISECKKILQSGTGEKIQKFLYPERSNRCTCVPKITTIEYVIEEFKTRKHIDHSMVITNAFIINGSDDRVRLVRRMNNMNFNEIMSTHILRISVFEEKEDTAYPISENDVVSPFLNYKKLGGDITYIHSFENSTPLVDLITATRELINTYNKEILGFLVEYRDVRTSTIKFVETVMDAMPETHYSVSITEQNLAHNDIDYVMMFNKAPVFTTIKLPTPEEYVILYGDE